MSLDSLKRILLDGVDESVDLSAEESDRIVVERRDVLLIVVVNLDAGLGLSSLEGLLDVEGLSGEGLGILNGVTDVDVVEEDVLSHCPELDTDTTDGNEALDGGQILEVDGVGNLAGSPLALVFGVVDERSEPLALVVRVGLVRSESNERQSRSQLVNRCHLRLPRTASRGLVALGVANLGGNPVTILLVIPFLGLLSVCSVHG